MPLPLKEAVKHLVGTKENEAVHNCDELGLNPRVVRRGREDVAVPPVHPDDLGRTVDLEVDHEEKVEKATLV